MENKWLIDKLGCANLDNVEVPNCHLLMVKGLWKYVDGSEVLLEDVNEANRTKVRDESQKAF